MLSKWINRECNCRIQFFFFFFVRYFFISREHIQSPFSRTKNFDSIFLQIEYSRVDYLRQSGPNSTILDKLDFLFFDSFFFLLFFLRGILLGCLQIPSISTNHSRPTSWINYSQVKRRIPIFVKSALWKVRLMLEWLIRETRGFAATFRFLQPSPDDKSTSGERRAAR